MTDVPVTLTAPAPPVARRRPPGITTIDETIKAPLRDVTDIVWAHWTHNIVWGCSHRSPACENCYAETLALRYGHDVWGDDKPRRVLSDNYWRRPLRWNRTAGDLGQHLRVFCSSMADVFEDHPTVADQRPRLWALIAATPNLDWLLLTKRPENIARMVPAEWMNGDWPVNVWVGATMEDQRYANVRTRHLAAIPAPVRFASAAPMLGPIEFDLDVIDWVITEGESGHHARPSHQDWFRAARDQCAAAGIPYCHKQHGEYVTATIVNDPAFAGGRSFAHPTGGRQAPVVRMPGPSGTMRGGTTRLLKPGEATKGAVLLDHDTIAVRVGTTRSGRTLDDVEHLEVPISPALEAA